MTQLFGQANEMALYHTSATAVACRPSWPARLTDATRAAPVACGIWVG